MSHVIAIIVIFIIIYYKGKGFFLHIIIVGCFYFVEEGFIRFPGEVRGMINDSGFSKFSMVGKNVMWEAAQVLFLL